MLLFLSVCLLAIAGTIVLVVLHIKEMHIHAFLHPIIGLVSLVWTCFSLFEQLQKDSK